MSEIRLGQEDIIFREIDEGFMARFNLPVDGMNVGDIYFTDWFAPPKNCMHMGALLFSGIVETAWDGSVKITNYFKPKKFALANALQIETTLTWVAPERRAIAYTQTFILDFFDYADSEFPTDVVKQMGSLPTFNVEEIPAMQQKMTFENIGATKAPNLIITMWNGQGIPLLFGILGGD